MLVLVKGGVVTGTVTNAKGDPLIAIGVRVRMVRDDGGRSYGGDMGRYYDNITDDRGVYRVYGIPTGTYVVSADGSVEERTSIRRTVNGFAKDLPTYALSSNREDANEINVRLGEEVSNVDIRYRGERGSSISGILNGTSDDGRGFSATLTSIVEGGPRWYNAFRQNQFAFDGIPNGEYHLVASASWNDGTRRLSESIVVNVRGADIEGLELTASPLASIDGRVVLEPLTAPPAECSEKRQPQFSEISVTAWHRVTEGGMKKPQFVWRAGPSANANAQGKFTVSDLAAGEYHFGVRFHTPQWFLKSVAFAPPAPNSIPTNAMGTWTTVKPGDRLSDLTFTFAQGSATVNGEISLAEGEKLPEKIVAFVVPAEIEKADEVLRYHAVPVSSDGRFRVYVAPGRYWIVAQEGTDDTRREMSRLRLPDGAEIRATLRRAAEEVKSEIQLKPCQSVPVRLPL
ncbi:MAG TPA: carboxypeptidase-like regulatory domain-containing protein [Pyrinomonadaceae bacterium]|nr:carboxypeptidase-like regulatory domain-containing protein [Pyrinomonadaceae bacterium]